MLSTFSCAYWPFIHFLCRNAYANSLPIFLLFFSFFSFFFFFFFGEGLYSSWQSPWTENPGGSWSIELQRVRQDWGHLAPSTEHGKKISAAQDAPQWFKSWTSLKEIIFSLKQVSGSILGVIAKEQQPSTRD